MILGSALLLCALLFMTACNNDLMDEKGQGLPGTPVEFTLQPSEEGHTRTAFGESTGEEKPVLWETGDTVHIYCPQALDETVDSRCTRNALYTIDLAGNGLNDDDENHTPVGGKALYWSDASSHIFYYWHSPKGNVRLEEVEGTQRMVVNIPAEQEATAVVEDGHYVACNMDYAVALGVKKVTNRYVSNFSFNPAYRAFNITMQANEGIDSYAIDSIDLEGLQGMLYTTPIVGDIYYDEKKPGGVVTTDESRLNVKATLNFTGGVVLTRNAGGISSLTATVFTLPISTSKAMFRVTVHYRITKDGETYSRKSSKVTNINNAVQGYNNIDLGELPVVTDIKGVNGECVDLGLPSGLLWAKCNVGAWVPEGFGNYYSWAETEPNPHHSTYKYHKYVTNFYIEYVDISGRSIPFERYTLTKYNDTDRLRVLQPEDDAATVNWGSPWRTPTLADWQELYNNCDWEVVVENGVNCMKMTSKTNSNYILLPFAGHGFNDCIRDINVDGWYWEATSASGNGTALRVCFDENGFEDLPTEQYPNRLFRTGTNIPAGLSIRPVRDR